MVTERQNCNPDTIQLLHDQFFRLSTKNPTLVNPDFRYHVDTAAEIAHFLGKLAHIDPLLAESASLTFHLSTITCAKASNIHYLPQIKTIVIISDWLSHSLINPEIPLPSGKYAQRIQKLTGQSPEQLLANFKINQSV